jgi:hypothetical protein
MPDFDNLLQDSLGKLEEGMPLGAVIESLDEEAKCLEPLICLAFAVREVPHPEPMAQAVQAQRGLIRAAALAHTEPLRRAAPRRRPAWGWLGGAAAFAAAGALTILVVMAVAAFNLWGTVRSMNSARLELAAGQVERAADHAGTRWQPLQAGDRLTSGQRIRTAEGSYARLVFFEGTSIYVLPNSDITFTTINGMQKSLQVELLQHNGETRHKVVPFQGDKSYFLVRTPSGSASVHGTSFIVRVEENGQAQFAVTEGKLRVQSELAEVILLAGQSTFSVLSGSLAEPGYTFGVQGSLLAVDEEDGSWNVSGMLFYTGPDTVIIGSPQLGDMVSVNGRATHEGVYLAHTIRATASSDQNAYFTGAVEYMNGTSWQVGQAKIMVIEDTDILGDLTIGDLVRVTVNILEDGTWLALKIEKLEDLPDPEPVEPAPPAQPMPELTWTPESSETAAPETAETPVVATTPAPNEKIEKKQQNDDCTGNNQHPTGLKLAQRYGVSYAEIMDWFCNHRFGFGEIDLAYSISHATGTPVEEVFGKRRAGSSWGAVKKQVEDEAENHSDGTNQKDKKDKKDKKDR